MKGQASACWRYLAKDAEAKKAKDSRQSKSKLPDEAAVAFKPGRLRGFGVSCLVVESSGLLV